MIAAEPPAPRDVLPATGTIAVVLPTWLGDAVMATPALDRLAAARPRTRIVGIAPPGIGTVLEGRAIPHDLIEVAGKGPLGPWRTAAALRRTRADAVILFPNSPRSALAAWLSRRPCRVGYDRGGRGPLLTHAIPFARPSTPFSTIGFYDDLVRAGLDADAAERAPTAPSLALTEARRTAAAAALGAAADRPIAVLVPGGNRANKRWPAERFAAIADWLEAEHGLHPVVTGSPGERELCARIAGAARPPVTDLAAANVGLGAVAGVIARARIVVTNDTGPRHLAAGYGVPTVALFGPTDARWTPLTGAPERVLIAEPFLPAEYTADRVPDLARIDRIPVSDVRFACTRLLAADRPESPRPVSPEPSA